MPTRVLRKSWWQAISATKAAAIASVAVAIAFASIAYVAYSSRDNQSHNCVAVLRVRNLVIQVLEDARSQSNRPNADKFYAKEIARAKAINCNNKHVLPTS